MSEVFLTNFMNIVCQATEAERCIAFDTALGVHDSSDIDQAIVANLAANEVVQNAVRDALAQGEAIITNNLITDPADAPQTNVHLSDLRMIVAIPLAEHGAIYIDQHIRKGVFDRDVVAKLLTLAQQIIADGATETDFETLASMYETLEG